MPNGAKLGNGLTLKESLFVDAYMACNNATEAAKRAGYSERSAYSTAATLLRKPRVMKELDKRREALAKKHQVTAERVLEEMAAIAFSAPEHYQRAADGTITLAPGAPPTAMRAVQPVKWKTTVGERGVELVSEYRLWDKNRALHDLGAYLGLFKDKPKDEGADDQLTPEERRERVLNLLRIAAKRLKESDPKRGRKAG